MFSKLYYQSFIKDNVKNFLTLTKNFPNRIIDSLMYQNYTINVAIIHTLKKGICILSLKIYQDQEY